LLSAKSNIQRIAAEKEQERILTEDFDDIDRFHSRAYLLIDDFQYALHLSKERDIEAEVRSKICIAIVYYHLLKIKL